MIPAPIVYVLAALTWARSLADRAAASLFAALFAALLARRYGRRELAEMMRASGKREHSKPPPAVVCGFYIPRHLDEDHRCYTCGSEGSRHRDGIPCSWCSYNGMGWSSICPACTGQPAPDPTPPLSPEHARELAQEGRALREEIGARFARMRRTTR